MATGTLFQQAVAAARAGKDFTARDLFLDVVRLEPGNEQAWMWLTGLSDTLDERIRACVKVLEINPANDQVRLHLKKLLKERRRGQEKKKRRAKELLQQARTLIQARKKPEALVVLHTLSREGTDRVEAWWLLAELSRDIDEQKLAVDHVLALAPHDRRARQEARRLRYFQNNPLDRAAMYEEQGDFARASAAYKLAATQARTTREWDVICAKVTRLEDLRRDKIVHVPPSVSIARLAFGPPLLYLALMTIQSGMDPFAHPEPFAWLGFPWVLLGGYLTAMASVRSRSRLWFVIFNDVSGGGSRKARFLMAAVGWTLVIISHSILFMDAFSRLLTYHPPASPW